MAGYGTREGETGAGQGRERGGKEGLQAAQRGGGAGGSRGEGGGGGASRAAMNSSISSSCADICSASIDSRTCRSKVFGVVTVYPNATVYPGCIAG
jgi:hypothetical protein